MAGRRRKLSRRSLVAALVLGCIVLPASVPVAFASSDSLEYGVKAAYLSKFGNFIGWPPSAFASADSAVNLCIAGEDPFGASLETAVAGHRIGDRPIVIRHLAAISQNPGCQILFVGGSDSRSIARILSTAAGAGVLTVTDSASTDLVPSIIRFVIQDDHVRFSIDDEAASRSGITVSSKLLSLALSVTPRKPAGEAPHE
jgi:YfiR/HmsC-like